MCYLCNAVLFQTCVLEWSGFIVSALLICETHIKPGGFVQAYFHLKLMTICLGVVVLIVANYDEVHHLWSPDDLFFFTNLGCLPLFF